ncbi:MULTISPECIES: SPOR domain-containing protein [Pasteurellaceae]|uniref:SPOR domain-containing protein n=1 Tax=Pasteurella atlantica TaxID=2827233 RepID=A0AAW8CRK5_9PAST|nr:SPOR domain-containing protein [Pasteurella atlantica]MBR0574138.1 SPOR domain-containing protein [Pasteurella atlantica]MDP8040041.1 SPOR domain-containing protein [Pasteurella atlantica]MDP8042150.1 SPOR domain-containing protein [Pasteurella atlantica]MDP8044349.1 SPOR domain-containing protein [Pasteurella atlantica]MDP8046410.1 SPOR domain-containing protein [Pasteurella atlantica]
MKKRDYIRPQKKAANNTKSVIASVVVILLFAIALLWFLKEKSPIQSVTPIISQKSENIPSLPSYPEKSYSYIKELQTHEISIDDSEAALTEQAKLSEAQQTLLKERQLLEREKVEEKEVTEQAQQTQKLDNLILEKSQLNTKKKNKIVKQFGIQCGAFKNKAQAENMYARLTMAGFEPQITTNAGWNRVIVGPLGNRDAANKAMKKAGKVADCLVIGM